MNFITNDANLIFTDTDSPFYKIKKMFMKTFTKTFSDYPLNSEFFDPGNKMSSKEK